ncbi:MAG TPA: HAD hydrolase-like protein [Alphaproteobacteria bacterium]|nr:HAD family hydrolase [Rhodospirillaceae bacterium]HRJ66053.1 HAD hydrolase-like protein [Alphaproteobacteria bacterium]
MESALMSAAAVKFKLPKPRAVLFDWDDTVVNNWNIGVDAINATLMHMGMEPWSEAEIRRRSGQSARDAFVILFGEERWQEADKVYYKTFLKLCKERGVKLVDGIEDVLAALARAGVYMGVVSNKRGDLLREDVARAGFTGYFSGIVGAGDAAADKPDAAPVMLALEGSGIAPAADVWFVGDSHTDMMCAHRTGCSGILIETKPPPEDLLLKNQPARRFATHGHFMEFIEEYFH